MTVDRTTRDWLTSRRIARDSLNAVMSANPDRAHLVEHSRRGAEDIMRTTPEIARDALASLLLLGIAGTEMHDIARLASQDLQRFTWAQFDLLTRGQRVEIPDTAEGAGGT